jgi:HEAT repeat protein
MGPAAVLGAALAATGCAATEEEARHEAAIERLDAGLPVDLDRLLERWSAASSEANQVTADIYRLRIESRLRDPETLFAVRTGLLVSDPTVVAPCAMALGFARAKGVGRDLVPLLTHESARVRSCAAAGLYFLGGQDCGIGEAMAVLADPDPGVRQPGAMLVARVLRRHADRIQKADPAAKATPEDAAYYDALLSYYEALSDVDPQVRVNVAEGMGIIGNPAAAPILVERGLADAQAKVRYASSQAIAALRSASSAEQVVAALEREFNTNVQRELHKALRAITGLDIGSVEEWKARLPEWRAERDGGGKKPAPPPVQPAPPGGK